MGKFIEVEKLQAMCRCYTDDTYIAKYLGCTVDQVAAARARLGSTRVSQYEDTGPLLSTADVREAEISAKLGSRDLLIAQLMYGQHWLKPDDFWDTVAKLRAEGCNL